MRIAVFTDTYLPATNGVVTATDNLIKGLADRGHDLLLVTPEFKDTQILKYKRIKHITCRGIPLLILSDFKTTFPFNWKLFRILKLFNPDIIHFQTPWTIGLQAIISAKKLHKPLIGTFHTFLSDPEYLKNIKLKNSQFVMFANKYCLYYYKKCDLVTAPAISTLSALHAIGLQRPMKYISNGISSAGFDNSNSALFRNRYAGKGQPLFLYVGRIAPEKNIYFLIEVFKELIKQNEKYRLLLIGDGPDYLPLKKLINTQSLAKNITMLGRISHDDILKKGIYYACDAFVTASKTENQPMTILEAQLNGLPCICMDAKGLPDLVFHEQNGLVSATDDFHGFVANLKRIANDKALISLLGKGALKSAAKHNLQDVIRVWEEVYSNIMATNTEEMIS
jgi:1,2-diacylglycerol 3-alpha-glucosyltransferase